MQTAELERTVEDWDTELFSHDLPGTFLKSYKDEYDHLQIKIANSSDADPASDGRNGRYRDHLRDYPYIGEKTCLFEEKLFAIAPKGMKLEELGEQPLMESFLNPMVKLTVDQWWKSQFGSMPHEAHHVPYTDIAIEMVEKGLGITFAFCDTRTLMKRVYSLYTLQQGRQAGVQKSLDDAVGKMLQIRRCHGFCDICRKIISCKLRVIPF